MKSLKILLHTIIVFILTLVTQVGGLIWIVVFEYFRFRKLKLALWKKGLVFMTVYAVTIFTIVPLTASLNDRKMLPVFHETIQPHNLAYVLLCRNYVRTDLYEVMEDIASTYKLSPYQGMKLIYLDAGFPFIDGFPLLPHLSHNDGRKADVSFVYNNTNGDSSNNHNPSLIGYGVYEGPQKGEMSQTQICEDAGYWQYSYAKYLGIKIDKSLTLNDLQTNFIVEQIQSHSKVQKVFIEPHLIHRMKIKNIKSKLRFHGCHAVRHDDHIHFQVKS